MISEVSMGKKIMKIILGVIVAVAVVGCGALAYIGAERETWDGYSLQSHKEGAIYDYRYYKESVKHDKAMILLPGLMASSFYLPSTNEPMWGMPGFGNLATTLIKKETEEEKSAYFDFVIDSLKCDENNVPLLTERIATMQDGEAYGSFDGMKYIYDIVYPVYGDRYDVLVWQYDWRQHNMGSAEELEKFINYNGWDEVVFFTHSMGGVVVANYLARSQTNRDKTELFVPFGCPFFGSMDAINNLFEQANPSGMMNDLFGMISGYVNREFSLTDVSRTMASVWELLNFPVFDESWYFDSDHPYYIGVDGTIRSGEGYLDSREVYDLLCSYDWARRADGSLRPVVANLLDYQNNLYIDDGKGGKIFVSDAVNTEYIVGIDVPTNIAVTLDGEGKITDTVKSTYGDGTVPAYSASAGHPLDDPRVHLVYGVEHGPLANDNFQATAEESGLRYVLGILEKYID